ncbi:MAG: O-antigen ligase family protein, partial [Actinobacteria bacterium]|nr:O-antigen ligase family protein [Actinomycetota bacterium]
MEQRGEVIPRIGAVLAASVRGRLSWPGVGVGGFGFLAVALLASSSGGYWPTAWSWTALLCAWVCILALLLVPAAALSRAEQALLAGTVLLLAWIALSATWSESQPRTLLEVQRTMAYLALIAAAVVVLRPRSYRALLVGVWAATVVVSTYSLATRLLPDRLGQFDPIAGYRLFAPLGYWNALGLFAAFGITLAVGLAARARLRLATPAALSLLVLAPTLYFTFGRGAWLGLGVGLVVAILLDPRRLQLLVVLSVLALCPALALASAYRSDALTRSTASLENAVADGRSLALLLVGLAVAQAGLVLGVRLLEARVHVSARMQSAITRAGAAAVALALVVAVVFLGGPGEVRDRVRDGFLTTSPSPDLNKRLFSLSSNGRADLWSLAWDEFEKRPFAGSGAGTYEIAWLRDRPDGQKVRDAHSLYLESLAELGIVGTALLVGVLALPLFAVFAARRRSLVPAAAGVYAAFLVHAAIDWDWEMLSVSAAALLCGLAVLAAARPVASNPLSRVSAFALGVAMIVVAAFSFLGVVGYGALASAEDAAV